MSGLGELTADVQYACFLINVSKPLMALCVLPIQISWVLRMEPVKSCSVPVDLMQYPDMQVVQYVFTTTPRLFKELSERVMSWPPPT